MAKVDDANTSLEISDTRERRRQQRLRVQVAATLVLPGTDQSMSALNQEISWGGAVFTAAQPLPPGSDSVLVNLPWVRGQCISISAVVLRTALLPNDQYLIVVRFSSLMPESHLRLEKLLQILGGKAHATDHKDSTDLFHELAVTVGNLEDFRQILEQIAAGRFNLHAVSGYEIDQSISLSVEGPGHLPELRLRARVIDINKAPGKYFDGSDLHCVTLKFEHPRDAITSLIDSLLGRLPKSSGALRRRASPVVGSSRTVKNTVAQPGRSPR
ncbi:PilZ domain-containing protein [uncultured Thiodictyon sp.]|uniref:PilZ domain-containing protein n=1 Tax=uncultured Thiodictyon sp. TaxID=1846217 RepID=UPI0025E81F54|nr:PilZ domain-containing protein [uncultured Thiodictyon sp.]